MSKYQMARLSAGLNFLGALLVFLSFQATSTNFLLVTGPQNTSALCIGDRAMFLMTNDGGVGIGTTCPKGEDTKPTAVVNSDAPWLGYLGWGILASGFIMQFFSVEKSSLSRDDLRALRKARKVLDSIKGA